MADTSKNHSKDVLTAGAAGVVVGAAVGSATAMVLSNEKSRKMIQEKMNEVGEYVKRKASRVDDMAKKEEVKEKLNDATDLASEKIKATENTMVEEGMKG